MQIPKVFKLPPKNVCLLPTGVNVQERKHCSWTCSSWYRTFSRRAVWAHFIVRGDTMCLWRYNIANKEFQVLQHNHCLCDSCAVIWCFHSLLPSVCILNTKSLSAPLSLSPRNATTQHCAAAGGLAPCSPALSGESSPCGTPP